MSAAVTDSGAKVVQKIRAKIQQGRFEFSQHATDQSIKRGITVQEIREAMHDPELVEDYPDARYGPSCLILGFTDAGRPLHVHCSHAARKLVKIITLYEPSQRVWVDFKRRRQING